MCVCVPVCVSLCNVCACVCVSVIGSEPEDMGVLMGTALCLRKPCFVWGSSNCSPIAAVKPPTWRGLFSWEASVWEAKGPGHGPGPFLSLYQAGQCGAGLPPPSFLFWAAAHLCQVLGAFGPHEDAVSCHSVS